MIGRTISHYEILEELGRGGMGVVYRARDTRLGRDVAIKLLSPHRVRDEKAVRRFVLEARAASALDHPNVGTIYDIDETEEGMTYIVMACYDAEPLRAIIDGGNLEAGTALEIASQIASGLAAAHRRGIVHRDIKPSNILVTAEDRAEIIDFGLAKLVGSTRLTTEGGTPGTAAYMSPEQARGDDVDHRSDIFSLGAILYEMITGEHPFRGEHEAALLYEIVHEDPGPMPRRITGSLPGIERIVGRAMAKDPEERYADLGEMEEDLRELRERTTGRQAAARGGRRRRPAWKVLLAAASAILFLAAVAVSIHIVQRAESGIDSIAVLPLRNVSGDRDREYFVSGMTDELISRLARIDDLKVISRTSAMRYVDSEKSLPEIAAELDVKAVLEGSVLLVGERVRISVELVRADSDRSIWAESYERGIEDVLGMQSEVALDVARNIRIELTSIEREEISAGAQIPAEAHEAYLKGLYHLNSRTPRGLSEGLEYFELSIEEAGDYAPAYAGVADAYLLLAAYALIDPETAFPKAEEAAVRAIELDRGLAEAHASLGIVRFHYNRDVEEAEREFELAVELSPNYVRARHWYALFLADLRRYGEALEQIRKARSVDPVSLIVNAADGLICYYAGRYDEALERGRATLELDEGFFPAHTVRGRAYTMKGMHSEAIAAYRKVIEISGRRSSVLSLLIHPLAASGDTSGASKLYEELLERSSQRYVSDFDMAVAAVALGREEEAVRYLELAAERKSFDVMSIGTEPLLGSLEDEPGFTRLVERIGLRYP